MTTSYNNATLSDLRKLTIVQLSAVCHEYNITPGHLTKYNRGLVERRLHTAIVSQRAKEKALARMHEERTEQRDNNRTPYINRPSLSPSNRSLPPLQGTRPSQIPILKRSGTQYTVYRRRVSIAENANAYIPNERARGGATSTVGSLRRANNTDSGISSPNVTDDSLDATEITKFLDNIKDVLGDNNNDTDDAISTSEFDESSSTRNESSLAETPTAGLTEPIDPNDFEHELRTINYLSPEQRSELCTERNSEEYHRNLKEILSAKKDNADSSDLDDDAYGRTSFFGRAFGYLIGLSGKADMQKVRLTILGCGITFCIFLIYKNYL